MKSPMLDHLRRCNNRLKNQSLNNYVGFLSVLLRSTDHDKARELSRLLDARDYTNLILVADSISSTVFRTAAEHLLLNQLSAVIRKYPWPTGTVSFDPRAKATETFLKSEHKCKRMNQRFSLYQKWRSPHELALSKARSWITYTLGDLSLSDVWDHCDFGPGASMGVHGNATNSARKLLAEKWTVTPSAFYYGYAAISRDPLIWELLTGEPGTPYYHADNEILFSRYSHKASMIDYNKLAFVPKTAKTERTIAVEPLLNGFVQKGVDQVMRKRLTRVGIDLSDQSLNQELARKGSLGGDDAYVTIDLSSASDSISIELCRYMLPPDWFDFLDSIRSKSYSIDGRLTRYHKFTTMGNGFCFPLETLIFASLCEVASHESHHKPDYSVYGDDIIVRASIAPRVLELLRVCGFTANPDKTFISGPFRESCGADWFVGEDVRPVSLDYAFDSVENIFKFCNLARSKDTWKCIFHEALEYLESLIPPQLCFTRPYKGNVDTALEVPLDVFLASRFARWHRKTMSWSWLEIRKDPWPDIMVKRYAGYNVALTRGALTGSTSPVPFAERRKTRTKLVRVCPSSGWSLFLPWTAQDYLPSFFRGH